MNIEVYESRHVAMAHAFNERLKKAGSDSPVLLSEVPGGVDPGLPVYTEARVLVDGDHIRGGYLLQWRQGWVGGQLRRICALQSPVSEGIIDRRFALAGATLFRHALSVNPYLYAVGMGGIDRALPRLLKSLGFAVRLVPFFFRVNRPRRFLRQINHLRSSPFRRFILDAAGTSGLGWLSIKGTQVVRSMQHREQSISFEPVDSFDGIADVFWERSRSGFSFAAARDAVTLRTLYPAGDRFRRLLVYRASACIGCVVVAEKQMKQNKYFGDMRIGVIADCLGADADASAVIQAATTSLQMQRVDLIVANFQHEVWQAACSGTGFFHGPSNHVLALAPRISEEMRDDPWRAVYLTRGDSDGLVNL